MPRTIRLHVRRQDTPASSPYWEEYELPYRPRENVISVLMEVAKDPKTRDGRRTSPVVYDRACLEEVCGSCAMRVNGVARMACTALIDSLAQPVKLEPLAKFPVVRDLSVDRGSMFESLKRVKAWVPIDGTYDLGPGPTVPKEIEEKRYPLSRCISCGCCLEACPQYTPVNQFVGAAVISQVRLFNDHPTGAALKDERLDAMMDEGGVSDCGKAGNCQEVCPKEIPLLESIAAVQRQATVYTIRRFFSK